MERKLGEPRGWWSVIQRVWRGQQPSLADTSPFDATMDAWRREVLAQRSRLEDQYYGAGAAFDKVVLTLSGGALGLSLTLVKDIVPVADAVWRPVLFGAWATLVVAVLAILFSMHGLMGSFSACIDVVDCAIEDRDPTGAEGKKCRLNTRVRWCNRVGIVATVCGLSALAAFVGANLDRGVQGPGRRACAPHSTEEEWEGRNVVERDAGLRTDAGQGSGSAATADSAEAEEVEGSDGDETREASNRDGPSTPARAGDRSRAEAATSATSTDAALE